jgi:Glycosyl transferase family 11
VRSLPRDIDAEFVNHNNSFSAHEDLRLMSSCQNHIIANSSFSWWGAWLNPSPRKIVYAPKYWLLRRDSYFSELLPPSWILDDNLDECAI